MLLTGCAWVGGRVGCFRAEGGSWLYCPSCCHRGAPVGVEAWIHSSFSELKLSAPSSWEITEGENKCFDQGIFLLHRGGGGGAREINPFCALLGSSGAAELTPWLPGVGIPFPGGFFSCLVSPVIARTFPFARTLARTFSLKYKGIFSKFYLQSELYFRALGQLPCKIKAVF